MANDKYLGDGVYASFDGYHIILDLRGQDSTTRIALEPPVFAALLDYEKRLRIQLEEEAELVESEKQCYGPES